jgi:hypothetical protein
LSKWLFNNPGSVEWVQLRATLEIFSDIESRRLFSRINCKLSVALLGQNEEKCYSKNEILVRIISLFLFVSCGVRDAYIGMLVPYTRAGEDG